MTASRTLAGYRPKASACTAAQTSDSTLTEHPCRPNAAAWVLPGIETPAEKVALEDPICSAPGLTRKTVPDETIQAT